MKLDARQEMEVHNLIARHLGTIEELRFAVKHKGTIECREKAKWVATSAAQLAADVGFLMGRVHEQEDT
jgi:hypothetical protein